MTTGEKCVWGCALAILAACTVFMFLLPNPSTAIPSVGDTICLTSKDPFEKDFPRIRTVLEVRDGFVKYSCRFPDGFEITNSASIGLWNFWETRYKKGE